VPYFVVEQIVPAVEDAFVDNDSAPANDLQQADHGGRPESGVPVVDPLWHKIVSTAADRPVLP